MPGRAMRMLRAMAFGAMVVGAVLGLAACRASEQGRILLYHKGTYLGRRSPPLTAAQLSALRERVRLAENTGPVLGAGAMPPPAAPVDAGALANRAHFQGSN